MDNSEYIENFFSGSPDPEQVRSFENRIKSDPVFAEEVAFYLSAQSVAREMARSEKKHQFKEYYQNSMAESPSAMATVKSFSAEKAISTPLRRISPRKLMYYMSAAAVVAAISFVVYTYTQRVSPQELAVGYERDHLTTLPVTMSSRSDSIQTGLRLYNEGKFQKARLQFELILSRDSSYYAAIEFAGLACLRLKNYDKALYYFKQLESHNELYSNPGLFYQAIVLMERNQPGDAVSAKLLLQQVVEKGLEGKEAARIMLDKL